MANINEILARAAALRDETALNSISPERAGGIMYDTLLALNELWLQQGAALVISKIYASVAAMEADTAPVSDLTGKPLRPGQIVVIASSDSDNGSVYRYNGTESPSWTLVGSIGNLDPVDSLDSDSTTLPLAAHQGKVLDGKISQLGQKTFSFTGFQPNEILNGGVLANGTVVTNPTSDNERTDWIPVSEGDIFVYTGNMGSWGVAVAGFDENRAFVRDLLSTETDYDAIKIVIPYGISWVIASSYKPVKRLSFFRLSNTDVYEKIIQSVETADSAYNSTIKRYSPDSVLDKNTDLVLQNEQVIGAGDWLLRYTNNSNAISKQSDGKFVVTLDVQSGSNPALWMQNNPRIIALVGQTIKYDFYCETPSQILFLIGATQIAINPGQYHYTGTAKITNPYGDYRMMFFAPSTVTIKVYNVFIEGVTYNAIMNIVDKLDERVTALENEINVGQLRGKRLSILGDSISTFGTPDQNNAQGIWTYPGNFCRYPQDNLLTDVNQCYWKLLLDKFGMVLGINESWAGSMVSNTQPTDSGALGPNRCISSQTRINHLGNNGTPDIILVYGGTNDIGLGVTIGTFNTESPKDYTDAQIAALPVATFADAYRAMLIRLLKTYPQSKIVVVLPNYVSTYYPADSLDNYIEVIKEECDYFGVGYIDIRTSGISIFNFAQYLGDGIHPKANGMELLFKTMCRERFNELDKTFF